MSDVLSRELPAPRRWQELESLAFDVYRRLWKTNDAQLHGRVGQPQAGVDVYGTDRVAGLFTGVQCKGKDGDYGGALTETELKSEVAKAITFQPPLDAYVVLTTAPNDAAIQRLARELTAEHKTQGLFEVQVTGWDTFRHFVAEDQEVLVKYFGDFAPVDIAAQIAAGNAQHEQSFARMEGILLRTERRLMSGLREGGSDDALAERVMEVSRLIGDGAPTAALRALERIQAEEGEAASPLARYRLLASMGNAKYALGDEAEAIELFREAHAAHPSYPNAKATLAISRLLSGDRAGAFEIAQDALRDDPTSARSASVFIDSAPDTMSLDNLRSSIEDDLLHDAEVMLHLAIRAHTTGDAAAHRQLAEEALAAAPKDWRCLSMVAETLMQPLAKLDGLALTHAIPAELKADVQRATELTGLAWERLKSREPTAQGRYVAANLISLLAVGGREAEADAILDEALRHISDYGPLVTKSAQRAASNGDWKAAAETLDSVDLAELPFEGLLLRAETALKLNDPGRATDLIDHLEKWGGTEPHVPELTELVAAFRVRIAVLSGADQSAAISEAVEAAPKAIVLRSLIFDDLEEENPLRTRLADEIRELSSGDLSTRERLHAAETLAEAGHHSLAADLFGGLHDGADSHALRRQLRSLHLADRRAEARRLFESLPQDLRTSPGYLSIGTNIYERAGLLKAALALVEKALVVNDVLTNRLVWVQLLARLGRHEAIINWLRTVTVEIDGSPSELMMLAQVIDRYVGHDRRSLEIGYRALRAGYSRPELHLGYAIGLVMTGRPDESVLAAPEVIDVGSGTTLINEATGEILFRVIQPGEGAVIERGEISPDDPFARRLIGLRVGDTVEVIKATGDAHDYRVAEVQSRHLFAMRRTLRDFPSLFPDNPAFGSFEIDDSKGDNKFEEMFALARRRGESGREIEAMYRENALPLPMVAKFTGSSVFELWDAFSAQPELGLKSAVGINEEFDAGRRAARSGIVLVDPATLYGWVGMGVSQLLEKTGLRLAVVQSTIDALRQLTEERKEQRGHKMGTLGFDGEQYRFIELTDEVLDCKIATATEALRLAERLILLPAEGDIRIPDRVLDLVADREPAYADTLLAAIQHKRALLTDDLGFRVLAQEAGAACTWTQPFAQAMLGATGITHPEYRTIVSALIESNYRFTQFGHAELLEELLETGWVMNDRLRTFSSMLMSETLDRGSVASLLAQLLIESKLHAPDDQKFAAFHVAVADAAVAEGKAHILQEDYNRALALVETIFIRNANKFLLPRLLRETTYLTAVASLTAEHCQIAQRQVQRIRQSLGAGGLWPKLAKASR